MTSKKQLSTRERSAYLLTGSLIAILIAVSPYIFYMYEIFPDGPFWENYFFTYESKFYLDVQTAMWTYLGKITPLFLLLIWFLTCKHWWYHAILVPIIMYLFQFISVIYDDLYGGSAFLLDTNGLIYLAPFFIAILCVVYLIRIKVFDRIYGIDLTEVERENLNPFSPFSDKEHEEIKAFQKNEKITNKMEEDYYAKL